MFRPVDWLLVLVAVAAVFAGLLLNGPLCNASFGPFGSSGCLSYNFPTADVIGAAIATLAVVTIVVRLRHR
jgi:hypothetical protein